MVRDDEERIKSKDTSQFRITMYKPPKTMDELYENIRGSAGMEDFRFVKYDTLDTINKEKMEEAMLDMIETYK